MFEADRVATEPCGCRYDIPTGVRTKTCTKHDATIRNRRNPVLQLQSAGRLRDLPEQARDALATLLREISTDANARAERLWRKRKAPMAAYWRAVAVYSRHIARAINGGSRCSGEQTATTS